MATKSPKFKPRKPEELLGLIHKTFPELDWKDFKYIDEGWDHEVLILDKAYVFRFPNDEDYLKLLKVEVDALSQLNPFVSTMTVPKYSFVAPDYSFAGYHIVPGLELTKNYYDSLSATNRSKIASQLAGFLSDIHNLTLHGQDFSYVPLSDMAETQEEDRNLAEKHLRTTLSATDFERVTSFLDTVDQLLLQKLPVVLLHGDVYSNHLLWDDKNRQLGIIDFSDMNRGDPAFDFAELYEYGKAFVDEVYDHYTGPKDDAFLDRALAYQKWVGVFMMVDHFIHQKTSFTKARETFDRTKNL